MVIVTGNTITAAGSNLPIPGDAQIIDLGDATLSPGFMDAHTHLTADYSGNYNERRLRSLDENVSQIALETIPHARATIEAGFTSVRDLGSGIPNSHDFPDVSLRNVINEGLIPGPRMLVATHGIGATGGHFDDTNGFRDLLFGAEPDWSNGIADGPDAIRKAVRYEVKNGADVIKAAVSGGVLSLGDEVDVPQLDPAEMAALVALLAASGAVFWRRFSRVLRKILKAKPDADFSFRPLGKRVREFFWEVLLQAKVIGQRPLPGRAPAAPRSVRPGFRRRSCSRFPSGCAQA